MRLPLVALLSLVPFAVGAADGDVTPAFLCEEFTGEASPQCLKCAKAIIPEARGVQKSCEKKCGTTFPGDALEAERIDCKINCAQAYRVVFEKFCR
jgi:hypothetical protein